MYQASVLNPAHSCKRLSRNSTMSLTASLTSGASWATKWALIALPMCSCLSSRNYSSSTSRTRHSPGHQMLIHTSFQVWLTWPQSLMIKWGTKLSASWWQATLPAQTSIRGFFLECTNQPPKKASPKRSEMKYVLKKLLTTTPVKQRCLGLVVAQAEIKTIYKLLLKITRKPGLRIDIKAHVKKQVKYILSLLVVQIETRAEILVSFEGGKWQGQPYATNQQPMAQQMTMVAAQLTQGCSSAKLATVAPKQNSHTDRLSSE